jgi:hypothetical protein
MLLVFLGCGSSAGTVSGTVLFKGEKVPSGTITFFVDGQVHQTGIHDGIYQLTGLPIGTAIVTVVRLDPRIPDPYQALNETRKQMAEKKLDAKELGSGVVTDIGQLEALRRKRHLLPYFYAVPETSDLRCTVKRGNATFDIDIH